MRYTKIEGVEAVSGDLYEFNKLKSVNGDGGLILLSTSYAYPSEAVLQKLAKNGFTLVRGGYPNAHGEYDYKIVAVDQE